jgi:hypothetical protein
MAFVCFICWCCQYLRLCQHCMVGWLMSKEWKRFGRKQLLPNQGIAQTLASRDWKRPWKISVKIAGVLAKISTKHLPHTNLESYHYNSLLSVDMLKDHDFLITKWNGIRKYKYFSKINSETFSCSWSKEENCFQSCKKCLIWKKYKETQLDHWLATEAV